MDHLCYGRGCSPGGYLVFRVPKENLRSWHDTAILKKTQIYTSGKLAYPDFKEENFREFLLLEDFSAFLKIERQYIQDVYSTSRGGRQQ